MRLRAGRRDDAFTLVELAIAAAAGIVLMLASFAMWEFSRRMNVAARARAESSATAFAVLHRIEQEVMRAKQIEAPDPDYPASSSIQLTVDTGDAVVRRAFRLADGSLVVDMKDESGVPMTVFEGITALEFAILDPPDDSRVSIACTVNIAGQQAVMQSAAKKRN